MRQNAKLCKVMLRQREAIGQTVVICGAGPSLAEHIDEVLDKVNPDQVWGCNSALTWLYETGRRVTHGIAVAGEDGLLDDWKSVPPVHYLLASCVWPVVTKKLLGRMRKVSFFHTYIGFEPDFYSRLYHFPNTFMVDGGLNVTNRAVGVADAMGFTRIVVIGADCCLRPSADPMPVPPDTATDQEAQALNQEWCGRQTMYADGRDARTAFGHATLMEGTIAGRRFVSRADMLESAKWLVTSKRAMGKRLELVGDTLPNWLLKCDPALIEEFLPRAEGNTMVNVGVRR